MDNCLGPPCGTFDNSPMMYYHFGCIFWYNKKVMQQYIIGMHNEMCLQNFAYPSYVDISYRNCIAIFRNKYSNGEIWAKRVDLSYYL